MRARLTLNFLVLKLVFPLTALLAAGACAAEASLTILHTNDWQSRLLGYGPNAEYTPASINDDGTVGGISRLATLVDERRQILGEDKVLLLDGGDYSMGTLFHTIIRETGAELQLMSALQYDAITLGNHEFDFRPEGLAMSIESAIEAGARLPPIVISNMVFNDEDPADDRLQALWKKGIIRPYVVLEKGGQRIGIFGLMGAMAADVAANAVPLSFSDRIEVAGRMVQVLTEKENVDLVVVLSHGGVIRDEEEPSGWRGDDIDLLSAVPGIDVIVGGHSHTPLKEPIDIGGRLIVQAGSEIQYLGELSLELSEKKVIKTGYKLHHINDSILGHPVYVQKLDVFKAKVTELFLNQAGFEFDQVLAQSGRHLSREYDDNVIANLVTDSIRRATGSDFAITTDGSIRDEVYLGSSGIQRVSDLFRVVPLGIGVSNEKPGYDLLKVWVTAKEIKNMIEVLLLAYQERGQSYYPRFSGLQVVYNTARLPFDRVTEIRFDDPENGYSPINLSASNTRLYSVGLNSYNGSLAWLIKDLSFGMLAFNAKNIDGNLIDFAATVFDADNARAGIQEVKEWRAFFAYLKSLPDLNHDGVVDLPLTSDSRLIRIHSFSPGNLFQNATWIMYAGTLILLSVLVVAFLIVRRLYRGITRRRLKLNS